MRIIPILRKQCCEGKLCQPGLGAWKCSWLRPIREFKIVMSAGVWWWWWGSWPAQPWWGWWCDCRRWRRQSTPLLMPLRSCSILILLMLVAVKRSILVDFSLWTWKLQPWWRDLEKFSVENLKKIIENHSLGGIEKFLDDWLTRRICLVCRPRTPPYPVRIERY